MTFHRAHAASFLAGALMLACAAGVRQSDAKAGNATIRLGTYDSRAIAIAHTNSASFRDQLAGLRAELDLAKQNGDDARAAELEALGPALQERLHRQGFGTEPVHNILAHVQDALPGIAARAGVDVIVSKWELVYQSPTVTSVDVTDLMVAEFGPDDRALQWIEDLADVDPVPVEELGQHDH